LNFYFQQPLIPKQNGPGLGFFSPMAPDKFLRVAVAVPISDDNASCVIR